LTNADVVRRLMEAFAEGHTEAQLELLDPDVELVEWPDSPDAKTFQGHSGAVAATASWAEVWEWLRNDVEEIVEAGDRVLVCGRMRGKGKASAVEVEIEVFNVFTFRDGKVMRMEFFTSKEPALRAAGLQSQEAR
jgi:ketosteroid isomerase-like protein